ncbi:MAG: glutaminase [Planctomycetota bacterium]
MQSYRKPLKYRTALEVHGHSVLHEHVGFEPSGARFYELALDRPGLPHNPLINAGAIMCSSLIGRDLSRSDRFDRALESRLQATSEWA